MSAARKRAGVEAPAPCPMCAPYGTPGFIVNAGQRIPCFDCNPTPFASQPDPEHQTRIDAERCRLEFGTKSQRPLDRGRKPITEAPLFGGDAQGDLFGDENDA